MPVRRMPVVLLTIGAVLFTLASVSPASADVASAVRINEVESSGGTPGDWVELVNTSADPVDLSGLKVKDNDDTHAFSVIPDGTTLAAGGYYVVEESALGFGLGSADSARLFTADGATLIDSYTWATHATTTYGRCPNGTGGFTTTTSPTKGAANDCSVPVRINEVESSGGAPGDWVELVNTGASTVDVSNWVVKDNDDTHIFTIPAATTIAAGGHLALDVDPTFGLGSADSARLFTPGGFLADSYSWTAHAATTYGRCPDGSGDFTTTTAPTKGAVNQCPGDIVADPWPGGAEVATIDAAGTFGTNMSGLTYEGSGDQGVLWAVKNGPGTLYRLTGSGTSWAPDPTSGWAAGKVLHYADGTGDTDSEGVTLTDGGSAAGIYVSTERNNANSGVSRPTILRFDPSGSSTSLNANAEWNLTADLPAVAANSGLEGIAWVPDSYLTAHAFVDESTGAAYAPGSYPNHGTGLFFVGLEANGNVYAYALDQAGTSFHRVASFSSGFPSVMDLGFEPETSTLWAVCDDTCAGRTARLAVADSGAGAGHFAVSKFYERPGTMPNLNNEGFAITSQADCVAGRKPVFWSDDSGTDGHALRTGTLNCTVRVNPTITATVTSTIPTSTAGWYRTPVTISYECSPGTAPLTTPCPSPVTLSSEGADQSVTRTVSAADGGVGTSTVSDIDIDFTVPTVTVGGVVDGGLYAGRIPKASCVGSDALSGIATCTVTTTHTLLFYTSTATAADLAGNVSTSTVHYLGAGKVR